ncbi:ADP-ribosylglycohydrolase family protein [Streptomyces nigrescens]
MNGREAVGSAAGPGDTDGARSRIEGLLLGVASQWFGRLVEGDRHGQRGGRVLLGEGVQLTGQPPGPLRHPRRPVPGRRPPGAQVAEGCAGCGEHRFGGEGRPFGVVGGPHLDRRMRAALDLAWNALANEVAAAADRAPEVESAVLPLRARISVRAGLGNLAAGLRPPATGHDNPHYFDDAACVRAAVLAVVHPGEPSAAAELAEYDARYTQDGDGVHGARAMAAAVAAALGGTAAAGCVEAAMDQLPEGTEIRRNALHAVRLARSFATDGPGAAGRPGTAFALVPVLEHEIVDHVYSYGIAAAETVPVALALALATDGRVAEAVPAAACLSRVADSAPALAGALTGALGGAQALPRTWRDACRVLSGCALPRLAGTDLVELAGLLARTELTAPEAAAAPPPARPEAVSRALLAPAPSPTVEGLTRT